jgi:hypothetical protein
MRSNARRPARTQEQKNAMLPFVTVLLGLSGKLVESAFGRLLYSGISTAIHMCFRGVMGEEYALRFERYIMAFFQGIPAAFAHLLTAFLAWRNTPPPAAQSASSSSSSSSSLRRRGVRSDLKEKEPAYSTRGRSGYRTPEEREDGAGDDADDLDDNGGDTSTSEEDAEDTEEEQHDEDQPAIVRWTHMAFREVKGTANRAYFAGPLRRRFRNICLTYMLVSWFYMAWDQYNFADNQKRSFARANGCMLLNVDVCVFSPKAKADEFQTYVDKATYTRAAWFGAKQWPLLYTSWRLATTLWTHLTYSNVMLGGVALAVVAVSAIASSAVVQMCQRLLAPKPRKSSKRTH